MTNQFEIFWISMDLKAYTLFQSKFFFSHAHLILCFGDEHARYFSHDETFITNLLIAMVGWQNSGDNNSPTIKQTLSQI